MDAFGYSSEKKLSMAEYLDQSAFDEKFEICLEKNEIRNLYHIENKYYVPVMFGSFRDMFEYGCKHMVHKDDQSFHTLMDPDTLQERLDSSVPKGIVKADCRQRLVDGTYRWVQYMGISGKEMGVPDGLIYFYVYDIQNQKDRLTGMLCTAHTIENRNPLTGLLTGESFIPAAQNLTKNNPGPWCCIAIDIQNYKIFHAWFGQEKSHYLLAKIGSMLRDLELNEPAVCAYYEQDSYAVLIRYNTKKIQQLFQNIREIIYTYSNSIGFMPAFGVVVLKQDGKIQFDLYDQARVAVELAKQDHKDNIKHFDTYELDRKRSEYALLSEFQNALQNHEIIFYLQPQCHVSTGKIVGAEALARWHKPDGSLISPGVFIPLLEKGGFIIELDKYLWTEVCRWLRAMFDRNITPVPISINVSQIDLLSMDVAAYLYALTENYRIPPRYLKIEITESAYAESTDIVSDAISKLQEKGFQVLMDDFGSGYSSLNMLDSVNANAIKLDMAFMQKETSLSKKGISIVESIFSMTKALEIPVIVEGVETEAQIAFLKNMGCRYVQGYYFYKPMPVNVFEPLLQDPSQLDFDGIKVRPTEIFRTKEFLNEKLFTDTMLNNILGAVAFYTLEDDDLTITRFNELFYESIGDDVMETRLESIQNYIVKEDHPTLYRTLEEAKEHISRGSQCEIRFYKSDGGIFWFRMHFFHLRTEGQKHLFYGQVEDVTETREQSLNFFEILREQSDVTMRINLDRNTIQYISHGNTLMDVDQISIDLHESVENTIKNRIENEVDRVIFRDFFNVERLKEAHRKAIYHESFTIEFKLRDKPQAVTFASYYIRHSKYEDLTVYVFAKGKK